MKIERCEKESFVVIGKEGSTLDGAGFIQISWEPSFMRMTGRLQFGLKTEK